MEPNNPGPICGAAGVYVWQKERLCPSEPRPRTRKTSESRCSTFPSPVPSPDPLSAAALFIFHRDWPTNQDKMRAGLLLWRPRRVTVIYRQAGHSSGCLSVPPPSIYSISALHLSFALYVAGLEKQNKRKLRLGAGLIIDHLTKAHYIESLSIIIGLLKYVCVCKVCSAAEGILITTINSDTADTKRLFPTR